MKLFSEVPIHPIENKIDYKSKILAIGSCFASDIGKKLMDAEFQALVNPFGTQFHPLAIEHTFNRIYARELYVDSEIFYHNGLYFSWDHSTTFSKPQKEETLREVNERLEEGNSFLSQTTHFIITLGTAWAYYLPRGDFYVSNCHKVPQHHFKKLLLSQEQLQHSIQSLILKIKDVRPQAEIIFTISPVRHIRDGYRENNISKGALHLALHQIVKDFPDIHYFPSYEIVLDELRDYRYFGTDLAHINALGLDYIWNKFSQHYFSQEALDIMKQIEKIKKAAQHRAQNPTSVQHKKFVYDTLKKATELKKKLHPNALANEIQYLKNQSYAY